MTGRPIQVTKSAYQYPLLIKQLWHTPLLQAPDQEIVYRDMKRFTYRQLRERIGRLASSLDRLGVGAGDTVGVLDWDSNRFLEAYFAVPMMGAVLQTVNVRLSPEQIAYTINHAGSSVLLVNDDFVPVLEGIKQQLPKVKTLILMSDRAVPQTGGLTFAGEYEDLAGGRFARLQFPGLRREHPCHHLLHDRDNGFAEGCLLQPSTTGSPFARRNGFPGRRRETRPVLPRRRLYADHPDVSRARLGVSVDGDAFWRQASVSGSATIPLCSSS